MRLVFVVLFTLSIVFCFGQKIDNSASCREMQSESYVRLHYENDLFMGQDENYTQGIFIEVVSPIFSKNPINKIFFRLKNDTRKEGIAIEHIVYTPYDYQTLEIQKGDRPFAAAALLQSFRISMSETSKQRIASHFSMGIMGPAAFGKEMQTGIHKLTGNAIPYGWRNQISNQFIVNYGIHYEKQLLRVNNNLGLYANSSVKLGNLFTNLNAGFTTTFGLINNPYESSSTKKFLLYGYLQPLANLVGYDGTLQGRIISDKSIYTSSDKEINRLVGQVNYGLILQTKNVYFEFSGTYITSELKALGPAAWGGIKIGVQL
ncbi:MAG: lipid A deacylase LpxR family protein [Bacteroidota bacterium]